MTIDSVARFDERFSAIRYEPKRAELARSFTADDVRAYVQDKARQPTDFSYPYDVVLETFPRDWWNDVVADLMRGPKDPGAHAFVAAAYKLAPDLFEAAPELAVRWLKLPTAFSWINAHRQRAVAGLERVLADVSADWRWQAAGFLLLVDRRSTDQVAATIAASDEDVQDRASWALTEAGWEYARGKLRPLWPERTFHLAFAPGHIRSPENKDHPTWHAAALVPGDLAFGGFARGHHHVMTLDPVPPELGISLPRLVLVCDLDFAIDDGSEQYFQHDLKGDVLDAANEATHPPFATTRVRLDRTRPEHLVQDWGAANGNENLFRLGGLPVFVQGPQYPKCSTCDRRMVHILSLDSEIPLDGLGPNGMAIWNWGSGGVANAFWCDACRISAWMHACT